MKHNYLWVYVILLILLTAGCQKDGWQGKIRVENGVRIIENPEQGIWSGDEVELVEDLIIGDESDSERMLYKIESVLISSNGRIFVLDGGDNSVSAFDEDGSHLFKFGGRGAGPGEFIQPWYMALDEKDNVYVSDVSLRKTVVFNSDGEYLKDLPKISGKIDLYKNKLLVSNQLLDKYGVTASILNLDNLEKNFDIEILHTYDPEITAGGISLGEHFQFLGDGDIYIAIPHPYEIRRYSTQGKLEEIIKKKETRIEPPLIRITEDSRFIMTKGSAGPCFMLSNDMIINRVNWYVPGEKRRKEINGIDFFNDGGKYLGSAQLQDYYRLIAIDSLDRLYVVRSEPAEQIVRYRLLVKG